MCGVPVTLTPAVPGSVLSMPFYFSLRVHAHLDPLFLCYSVQNLDKGRKKSDISVLGKLLTHPFLAHRSPEAWVEKPSFGKPLEEHLMISGREIAFPIEACVTMLLECGMQEEVGTKHPHPSSI